MVVEEILLVVTEEDLKCMKQSVVIVERDARFLLSQQMTSQFTAVNVLKITAERELLTETVEAEERKEDLKEETTTLEAEVLKLLETTINTRNNLMISRMGVSGGENSRIFLMVPKLFSMGLKSGE